MGRALMPWQQEAVDVAYEYDPESGLFRYDEADITVPRQSGKTTITLAKKVHRLTALSRLWGPQRSTYTAQTRLKARAKLERDFADLLRGSRSFREVPNVKARPQRGTEWRLSLNNGSEHIQFGPGSYLQIDAPSRTAGHGDTLDDGTIDEAFAREDDAVEMAMRPAMATRKNAQLWVISTAGDAKSFYLWRKVLSGRKASESGEHGRTCYIEYSAPDDADPGDPATWWGCMPALGITITEDFIRGEWERAQRKGEEGVDAFRRAYLNQWPEIPVLDSELRKRALDVGQWAALAADPPELRGPSFGVDLDEAGTAYFAVAWHRPDGLVHVQLAGRSTASRLQSRADELTSKHGGQMFAGGPAAKLLDDCEAVSSAEFAAGCRRFADLFDVGELRHSDEHDLNDSVGQAKWRSTGADGAMAWQLKDVPGIGPLAAVTRALHGLMSEAPPAIW